ncbi:MAG: hypothetical protein HRT35_32875, partial [Algicola sp.]|nr:hypothetical protein [Algicola sp.]
MFKTFSLVVLVVVISCFCGVSHGIERTVLTDKQVSLPQHYDTKALTKLVNEHSELVIEGINNDNEPRIVILRFDDSRSQGYHSRVNIERVVTPGRFSINLAMFGLKTGDKRLLNWQQWQRFIVFSDSDEKITVNQVVITRAADFSAASMGFDLGSSDSPVLRGMKQVTPAFAGIKGQHLKARNSVSGNALTRDGIEGIKSLTLDVPNGRWQVTLWFAMNGEWENLPRQQNQHISVQGKTVWQRNLSPQQWISDDYLAGQYQEAYIDGSPWQLFGDQPSRRVTTNVLVSNGRLQLDFAGQTTHDNYLSGVFISPGAEQGRDTSILMEALKQRFEQKWQVANTPAKVEAPAEQQVSITKVQFSQQWQPDIPSIKRLEPLVSVANGFAVLDFKISSTHALDNVQLQLTLSDPSLVAEVRQGVWRYQRPQGSATLLSLSADELQSVYPGKMLRLPAQLSRRINLLIPVKNQSISGVLTLKKDGKVLADSAFDVKVLNVDLPPIRQSVGIYHEKAPHWGWFDSLKNHTQTTLSCDYRYLKKLGFTALSAPLATPGVITADMSASQISQTLKPYLSDLKLYHDYFDQPVLDYTTVKRLDRRYRNQPALKQRQLAALNQELNQALNQLLKAEQLPMPQFAVVDEMVLLDPRALGEFSANLAQWQNALPMASFVGQLNKPDNQQLTPMLDTALVNQGFGTDKQTVTALQRQGKSVWLYNMGAMRMAAGFYLWQSKAQGYLQWHGRMPTGQPFNPVDGREADFQLIYPALQGAYSGLQGCIATPDINAGLLAIALGIEDRRWISWLIKTAKTDSEAMQLLSKLRKEVPVKWADAKALPAQQVHHWRGAITALAIKLS